MPPAADGPAGGLVVPAAAVEPGVGAPSPLRKPEPQISLSTLPFVERHQCNTWWSVDFNVGLGASGRPALHLWSLLLGPIGAVGVLFRNHIHFISLFLLYATYLSISNEATFPLLMERIASHLQ